MDNTSLSGCKHYLVLPDSQDQAEKRAKLKKANHTAQVNRPSPPTGTNKRICMAMLELRAIGISEAPRLLVALFSGYENENKAGFKKALSTAKKDGFVEYTPSTVRLTDVDIGSIPPIFHAKDNDDVQQRLRDMLRARKHYLQKVDLLFSLLKDGKAYTRKAVADKTGYSDTKSPGFSKFLSTMRSLGMIQYTSEGHVQLADIAFPFGRGHTSGESNPTGNASANEVVEL